MSVCFSQLKHSFVLRSKKSTTHSCRRSFATNYYKRIPTTVIMGMTGHVKESTFLQYINKSKDKDENAKLFFEVFKKELIKIPSTGCF